MEDHDAVRDLMAKLMEAVESSLSSSTAVREALAALVREGYEARLFFVANTENTRADDDGDEEGSGSEDDRDEAPVLHDVGARVEDGDIEFELTKLDRAFLKSLSIRPESS